MNTTLRTLAKRHPGETNLFDGKVKSMNPQADIDTTFDL